MTRRTVSLAPLGAGSATWGAEPAPQAQGQRLGPDHTRARVGRTRSSPRRCWPRWSQGRAAVSLSLGQARGDAPCSSWGCREGRPTVAVHVWGAPSRREEDENQAFTPHLASRGLQAALGAEAGTARAPLRTARSQGQGPARPPLEAGVTAQCLLPQRARPLVVPLRPPGTKQ